MYHVLMLPYLFAIATTPGGDYVLLSFSIIALVIMTTSFVYNGLLRRGNYLSCEDGETWLSLECEQPL